MKGDLKDMQGEVTRTSCEMTRREKDMKKFRDKPAESRQFRVNDVAVSGSRGISGTRRCNADPRKKLSALALLDYAQSSGWDRATSHGTAPQQAFWIKAACVWKEVMS